MLPSEDPDAAEPGRPQFPAQPAGDGVYFVRGDITSTDDLERCGIREASSAIVFPAKYAVTNADGQPLKIAGEVTLAKPAAHTTVAGQYLTHPWEQS